jgi:hypothetical protein
VAYTEFEYLLRVDMQASNTSAAAITSAAVIS